MKIRLVQDEKQMLFHALVLRYMKLFMKLEKEMFDLDVNEYYDQYYKPLKKLLWRMERFYPDLDMSTNDIDVLYRRIHMRSK